MTEAAVEVKDTPEVLLEKLRAANAEAKSYREAKEALEAKVAEYENDDTASIWKQKAVMAHVRSALKEQGVKDIDRVLKVLDLEGVDLDDKDNLAGFSEKVETTKKEWPELFDTKKRVANKADIFSQGEVKEEASTTEKQVARLLNRQ